MVVAQVPSEPIERDLYRELLVSMAAPAMAGGTLAREKDICRALLRTVGAKMKKAGKRRHHHHTPAATPQGSLRECWGLWMRACGNLRII